MDSKTKQSITDCLGRKMPNWDEIELFSLPLPGKFGIGDFLPEKIVAHVGLSAPKKGNFFKVKPPKNVVVLHDNIRIEFEKLSHMIDAGLNLDPGSNIPAFARYGDFDAVWLSGPRTLVVFRPEKFKITSAGVKS